jgi:hypothetical protein
VSLIDHWQANQAEFQTKKVHQILTWAGDGHLLDGNTASLDFRNLLKQLPVEVLKAYSDECVVGAFKDSGLALQDIINEVGHRLDFQMTHGKYRGSSAEPGHDGLWRLPNGKALIIEVKTTADFSIDLDRIAEYKKHLVAHEHVEADSASILVVIGRPSKATRAVEAQIRGGRHAWEMRLISVEALFRLLEIRQSIEGAHTLNKIHELLFPMEFTSLDGIIDLVFSTKEEVTQPETEPPVEATEAGAPVAAPKSSPVSFQAAMIPLLEQKLGLNLVKQSRVAFENPQTGRRFLLLSSRIHEKPNGRMFWFALHSHQRDYLSANPDSAIALACGSAGEVLLVPQTAIESMIPTLSNSTSDDRNYWHLVVTNTAPGDWKLSPLQGHPPLDLGQYLLQGQ